MLWNPFCCCKNPFFRSASPAVMGPLLHVLPFGPLWHCTQGRNLSPIYLLSTHCLGWHMACPVQWILRITLFLFWKRFQKTKFSWLDYKSDPAENSENMNNAKFLVYLNYFQVSAQTIKKVCLGEYFFFCVYGYFALWPAGLNLQAQGLIFLYPYVVQMKRL